MLLRMPASPPKPLWISRGFTVQCDIVLLRRAQTQSVIPVHRAVTLPENRSEVQRARNPLAMPKSSRSRSSSEEGGPEGQKLLYAATTPAQRLSVEGAD